MVMRFQIRIFYLSLCRGFLKIYGVSNRFSLLYKVVLRGTLVVMPVGCYVSHEILISVYSSTLVHFVVAPSIHGFPIKW